MSWMYALDVTLLLRLLAAHVLVDHILGFDARARSSVAGPARWRRALLHGVAAAVAAYLFAARWSAWWLPVVILAAHLISDRLMAGRTGAAKAGIADQFGHLVVLAACWVLLSGVGLRTLASGAPGLVQNVPFWVIARRVWHSHLARRSLCGRLHRALEGLTRRRRGHD